MAGLVEEETVGLEGFSGTDLLEGLALRILLVLHFFTIDGEVLLANSQRVLLLLLKKRGVLIGRGQLRRLLFRENGKIVGAVSVRLHL